MADSETPRSRQRLAKALAACSASDQRESIAWWLEHGPEPARFEAIVWALTLAGELLMDDDPELALAAAALGGRVIDKVTQ